MPHLQQAGTLAANCMGRHLFVFILSFSFTFNLVSQTRERCIYMCQLKDSISVFSATDYSDKEVFKIYKSEIFLYDSLNQIAWLQNGHGGHLPPEVVAVKDKLDPFRMKYSKLSCQMLKGSGLLELSKRKKVNLQNLINRSLNEDPIAFNQYLAFSSKVSEHTSEIYWALTWRIIHFWSDEKLSAFIADKRYVNSPIFVEYVKYGRIDSSPICDLREYYQHYFPRTFKIMDSEQ
jgi:hypothetical protein